MKQVIILVGPKGAGKSTIGDLLEKNLRIHFVRVEPLFIKVRESFGASHPDYERLGYELVLSHLCKELSTHNLMCFESTGASEYFMWLLVELRKLAHVLPVQILVERTQCLDRITQRDASIHINVSDDQIDRINDLAYQVDLPWAARIDNRGPFDASIIMNSINDLLHQSH